MSISIIITNNQIELNYNNFWNFSDEKAGNVTEPTPNFELELEIYLWNAYLKEPILE